jgi:hypothetical protein
VIGQHQRRSDKPYKEAFVDFIRSRQWHWFITIPIGSCDNDDLVLKRLRAIEAAFCGKYLVNRYQKLPDQARFAMVVAFEGDAKRGDRHAHVLAYIPPPSKRRISKSMMISLFPWEFRFLWNKIRLLSAPDFEQAWRQYPWEDITFGRANTVRKIYTVKDVRQTEVSWSRFEFVTPPKFKTVKNQNRSVVSNRDRQRRAVLKREQQWRAVLGVDNHEA